MNPKALIFGVILSVLLPVAVIVIFNFRAEGTEPTWPSLPLLGLGWAMAFFVPAFSAGFIAKRAGWLYGLALGAIPIAIALFAKYEVPFVLVVGVWFVAITGGALGHFASRDRSAL